MMNRDTMRIDEALSRLTREERGTIEIALSTYVQSRSATHPRYETAISLLREIKTFLNE